MSAMADFAKLPTRQKVMVFAIVGIVLALLYRQFILKGLDSDLEEAQNENASKISVNKKLERDIPEFDKLKERMITLKRIIDENQKALPTEAELPAFFETLNRKVLESGVEVVRSRQGNEETVGTFIKVPIEYEIQGTYGQIKKFFASLVPKRKKPGQAAEPVPGAEQGVEERERIVSIENLSLTSPFVRNREILLTARFTASTYRQTGGGMPALPKAAPARPPARPPAPPPGAPASTPKGAKEQTENALDKGDVRNRNAAGVDEAKTPSGVERMKEGK